MKDGDAECKLAAHMAVKWMRKNGHTKATAMVSRARLADAVGFKPGQWPKIKAMIYGLGYPLCEGRGRGGGFWIGKRGEQGSGLVVNHRDVLTRLTTIAKTHRSIGASKDYPAVIDWCEKHFDYDPRTFSEVVGNQAAILALPAPATN